MLYAGLARENIHGLAIVSHERETALNVNEMGSCPSKRRKSLDQRHKKCNEVEQTKLETRVSGMVENTEPESHGQANSTNEDKSTVVPRFSTEEQHTVPKVRQSFSWLASSPVGHLDAPTNQQKEKPRKAMEKRDKSTKVMQHRNEKYLKSRRHSDE